MPQQSRSSLSRLVAFVACMQPLMTAGAQEAIVRGTVVDEHGRGLPYASVDIEATGQSVLTDDRGRFVLRAGGEGPHAIRVRQIGFTPLRHELRESTADTLRMTRVALVLAPVRVTPRLKCTSAGFAGTSQADVALLFEQARMNAERHLLLATEYPVQYRLRRTERFLREDGSVARERIDTLVQRTDTRTPYAPGSVLVAGARGATDIRIPSLADVATPAFQGAHCFEYAGVDSLDGVPVHVIRFAPTARVKTPDVEGTLYIDASTALLRRGEFRLVALPSRGIFFSAVEVNSTYREIRPYLPLLAEVEASQVLRKVSFEGEPLTRHHELRVLLDHRFIGAMPGADAVPHGGATSKPEMP